VAVKAVFEEDPPAAYEITVSKEGNGTASASPNPAAADTEVELTAHASSGYKFKEWQIVTDDSETVTIVDNAFIMPANPVEIKAVFELIPPTKYAVILENDGNGSLAADKSLAAASETVTLTCTPNAGYRFKEWETSPALTISSDGKFTMPTQNVTVKAIFEPEGSQTEDDYSWLWWLLGILGIGGAGILGLIALWAIVIVIVIAVPLLIPDLRDWIFGLFG